MTAPPQNDCTQIRDAGYHPLKVKIFRGETIIYLSEEEIERMIREWCETKKQPEGLFICADAGGWTACEGQTGECYVEWFHFEKYALRWLVYADGDDTDKLHRLDEMGGEGGEDMSGNMTSEDCEAVMAAAMSYRVGAMMSIYDIRIAAAADGHPLDHADGREIAAVLRHGGLRSVTLDGPSGVAEHCCHWIREADE